MKKITTAIAITATLFVTADALAKGKRDRVISEEQMAVMISEQQSAVDELDLLPTVAEQVKTLIAERGEKRYQLHTSFREQQEALKEEYDASLGELLTDEQIDELKSSMRAKKRDKFDRERKIRSAE